MHLDRVGARRYLVSGVSLGGDHGSFQQIGTDWRAYFSIPVELGHRGELKSKPIRFLTSGGSFGSADRGMKKLERAERSAKTL